MAGEAKVQMRWPTDVHERAKELAASRGTTVTAICLGLMMVELERAAAQRDRAEKERKRAQAMLAAERGVRAPTGWKWTTCWERTYAEQGIRVTVRPAMTIVGCGWVWEAVPSFAEQAPIFRSAEGDSNWSALEAIENAEAEMKRRCPDLAKEDDDDIPF